MTDLGISLHELQHHFGTTVPQEVFDFVGSNRLGLTVQQKRDVMVLMAQIYLSGVAVGQEALSEDDRVHLSHRQALERLAERIGRLENNVYLQATGSGSDQ